MSDDRPTVAIPGAKAAPVSEPVPDPVSAGEVGFEPLANYVVIEQPEEELRKGLLHLPNPISQFTKGAILAMGPGQYEEGVWVAPEDSVRVGDVVFFNIHACTPLSIGGRKLLITKVEQLIGRVRAPKEATNAA